MLFNRKSKLDPRFVSISFSIDRSHISSEFFNKLLDLLNRWFRASYFFKLDSLIPFNKLKFEENFKGSIYADDKEQNLGFFYPYHLSSPFVVEFDIYSENFNRMAPVFSFLLNLNGFYVAYAFNREDTFIQNNSDPEIYRRKNIALSKDILIKNQFGDIRVDIKKNPGRRVLIDNMWLMSAWQMWFGQQSYGVFDKEKLLTFPKARLIREESNFIHIQLYEHHLDADKKKCRVIQQSFRDWMRMDEIDKVFNK